MKIEQCAEFLTVKMAALLPVFESFCLCISRQSCPTCWPTDPQHSSLLCRDTVPQGKPSPGEALGQKVHQGSKESKVQEEGELVGTKPQGVVRGVHWAVPMPGVGNSTSSRQNECPRVHCTWQPAGSLLSLCSPQA